MEFEVNNIEEIVELIMKKMSESGVSTSNNSTNGVFENVDDDRVVKPCHVLCLNQLPTSLILCPGLMVFKSGLSLRMSSILILKRAEILLKVSPFRMV